MGDRGINTSEIGYLLDRSERTIRSWIKAFQQRRLASIFSGHLGNNNAGKLTREQKNEIQEILASSPGKQGLPKEFWNVPQLRDYIFGDI